MFGRPRISPQQARALAEADQTLRVSLPQVLDLAGFPDLASELRRLKPVQTRGDALRARRTLDRMHRSIEKSGADPDDRLIGSLGIGDTALGLICAAGDSPSSQAKIREGADPATLYDETWSHTSRVTTLARRRGPHTLP